jgi:hypothetical protein
VGKEAQCESPSSYERCTDRQKNSGKSDREACTKSRLTRQVEFVEEKCKRAAGGNPMAHWAIRSALRAVVARSSAGYDSVRCAQLACGRPRPIRFRITNTNPTPSSMRATELGSGAPTGVRAPAVRLHPSMPFASATELRVESGPPSYPTKDPMIGVENMSSASAVVEGEVAIESCVRPEKMNIPLFAVNGPTVGVSPLIVTSSEMIASVVLSITMSPPSVQPETEHDVPPKGDRLPDTSSVSESAWTLGALIATNSIASRIHCDFLIYPFSRGVLIEDEPKHLNLCAMHTG